MAAVAALVVWAPSMRHGSTALPVVHAQSGCSNANLNASYAFTFTGFSTPREGLVKQPEVPTAVVGVIPFDGAGNVSYNLTLVVNGSLIPAQSGTGTYTVNSNCTGSVSFTTGDLSGINFNIVIIGSGTELFGILTNSGLTQTGDGKKQ